MDFIKNLAGRMTMERDRHQKKAERCAQFLVPEVPSFFVSHND